jgi:hypothetical protein
VPDMRETRTAMADITRPLMTAALTEISVLGTRAGATDYL